MKTYLKRIAYRTLSTHNYLRLLQYGYFTAYKLGLLKRSPVYKYHYFVRHLIYPGDVVLDIGANLGYYSKLFAAWVGKTGHVYSVEPIKIYNDLFRIATRKYKNITLYPYALGTEEKEITLVAPLQNGYMHTGLPHIYDPEKDEKPTQQTLSFSAQMKIPARLFSSLQKIDYIKCDIEGCEVQVLENMKDLIARNRPIVQVEISGNNHAAVFALLQAMDYLPYRLHTQKLHLHPDPEKEGEGDFLFIPKENQRASRFIA